MLFGTPRYIAPETVCGTDPADHRFDLYNIGGVAYWMLTGQPPFASTNPDDRFGSASEVDAALREIAFDDPWSEERAREWWTLHALPDKTVTAG